MKYAALLPSEWNPRIEGYPDDCCAIVLLNDNNTVAVYDTYYEQTGTEVGSAAILNANGDIQGYIPVPMDVVIDFGWTTEQEALHWAQHRALREMHIGVLEQDINAEIALNEAIDELRDDSRWNREFRYLMIGLMVMVIILLFVLVSILVGRGSL